MAKSRFNPRLAKIHRNYTVGEVADLYHVHKNTVRRWIKDGLPTSDDTRPTLILGRHLAAFLHAKRTKNKRPCKPGEIYCIKCRTPQAPAGDVADYMPTTETLGSIVGICPTCDTMIHRRVNPAKLEQVRGKLEITIPQALRHIGQSSQPSVNGDLRQGTSDHDNTQRQ